MEKKMQKQIKTMDHFERAKREEAAPLIDAAFQRCLAEEKLRHEREQQLEVELSRERHDGDVKEKYKLARVMDQKMEFQERVVKRREEEFRKMTEKRDARLSKVLQARKEERGTKRKMLFYIRTQEETSNSYVRKKKPANVKLKIYQIPFLSFREEIK